MKPGLGENIFLCLLAMYFFNKILGGKITMIILAAVFAFFIHKWYKAATVWKRLGVESPPAFPLIGHFISILRKGLHVCDMDWTRKHGDLFGVYLFTQPELFVSDQELLKKILVKDFHNFTNRRDIQLSEKSIFRRMVSILKDDDWKNTRNKITPAFTSGKLKGTMHLMENSVDTLCKILNEQTDWENGVDVKDVMGNMTMDVIAAAAFALDVDAQRNPNNEFSKQARDLNNVKLKDWRIVFNALFPWTTDKLHRVFDIQIILPGMEEFYMKNLSKVLMERRRMEHHGKLDFLQLLINAADEEKKETVETDTTIDHGVSASKAWSLTDNDIIAQSFLFLFAGHETTATTLSFACYLLAWHPEEQEKCLHEIKELVEDDEAITYDHVQRGLPYLEAVMNETLRIFPPAVRFDRFCQQDYQLTDKLRIPAGTIVNVPVYAIHHSPENYEDPEKFDPERFLVKEKKTTNPFAFLPFGFGPRNCIGMRFAQLEVKLVLSNIIRKFHIETCPKTEAMPIQLSVVSLMKTKNPIRLNFKRREE